MKDLRFRQIHLDFHTSEKIPSVGEAFNAEKFAHTLKEAHVNSITCFARGHHGMLYYDSKANPELVHPALKVKNLLEQQIDACHAVDIRVPIYTTVQWDYHISQEHPEWCCLTADGGLVDFCNEASSPVYEPGFYRTLCVNSPYRDFLKTHIKDIFESIGAEKVDGIFLDIVNAVDCSCRYCVADMTKKGYNAENKKDRAAYARKLMAEFKQDMSAFIRSFKEDVTIFYNAGHVNHQSFDAADAYSHWELESLPSGDWGYTHFTNTIRFARTSGKECLAQTGKFHTMWGDFHSFKNLEALQYECYRMLAFNAKCLIGDQLNPDGKLSPPVYDLIGKVYSEIEKKEPWCDEATPLVEMAILTPESLETLTGCGGRVPDSVNGCCAILDEMNYLFDIVETRSDWFKYKVLMLPDTVVCDESLVRKLQEFMKGGGYVIASGDSTMDPEHRQFVVPEFGITYLGKEEKWPSFIMPNDSIGKALPKTEHVMYMQGNRIALNGASGLLDSIMPYFSRTWEHFCSHRHTPSCSEVGTPAITRLGFAVYFSHPIFTLYDEKHPKWCKEIVKDALQLLLPEKILETNGPTTMVSTVNEQPTKKRYVLHALHYIPLKSSKELFTIEDVIPLYNISFSVKVPKQIISVTIVPEGRSLEFTNVDGRIEVTIPKIEGHTMLALEY